MSNVNIDFRDILSQLVVNILYAILGIVAAIVIITPILDMYTLKQLETAIEDNYIFYLDGVPVDPDTLILSEYTTIIDEEARIVKLATPIHDDLRY